MSRLTLEALESYYPKGGLGGRLQPLPDYNAIYVRNAKVGTGTTLLWLHRMHTGNHDFTPVRSIHTEQQLPRPDDVGWDTVVEMLNGAAHRFAFVRDPIRRAESAYLNKVIRKSARADRRWVRRVTELQGSLGLSTDPDQELTFDQFIAALEAQEPLWMNTHWRPQHLNLMHPLVEYDIVGRLENYSAALAEVRQATGMPDVPVEIWRNASTRPDKGLFDGRPGLLRRVRDLYAVDFELYGY
jgi:hypothetical protein